MTDKEKLEPQFKVGDIIRSKHWETAVHKIISMDDKSYCLDNGGKVDISSQQLWELVEEPVSEEWIKELRTKLDSMSKEDFKKVFDKYAIVFKEEPVSEELEEAAHQYYEPNDKFMDGFKKGAKWQFERVNEALLSEVLPCFMHGGEADEVVAKLDEVLNKKK